MGLLSGDIDLTQPQYDHNISVSKSTIADFEVFKDYIALFNLKILSVEKDHYILHGEDLNDIRDFLDSWNATE